MLGETMLEVSRYYNATKNWQIGNDLPTWHGASDWTKKPELVETQDGTELISVRPLAVRLKWAEGLVFSYGKDKHVEVIFTNVQEEQLAGKVFFKVPEDWQIEPQTANLNLAPGITHTLRLTVKCPERDYRSCRSMAEYMKNEFVRYISGQKCLYEVTEAMLKTMA